MVRAFRGRFDHPPDVVAHPRDEAELEAVLAWCADAGAAAIPFGGGTSVVGGVEPALPEGYAGAVSVDLKALDRVLEVDTASSAARIQGGATGPGLEDQLREHGLTLRHFPQSFEYSTLGGWVATRAGGHFATLATHIDDLVESVRAHHPGGRLGEPPPAGVGRGAEPRPADDRLGGRARRDHRGLGPGAASGRASRPRPACSSTASRPGRSPCGRSPSPASIPRTAACSTRTRRALTGAAPAGRALLVLGFESADHPLEAWLGRALELCGDHGGEVHGEPAHGERGESEGAWRDAFIQAPYLRDTLVAAGILAETFETAITWDRFDGFVAEVREAARTALGDGVLTCRITHAYPDGAAPYFTVLAPARRGSELEQWAEVKAAASEAILNAGGTVTHHHAVGRDHRPWYDRQRPEPFAAALRAAKAAVDPAGILNPGVLLDPAR